MKFKGAIFDFDGVVVDTTPLHYNAWKKLLVDYNSVVFDARVYEEKINGRRSAEVLPELLPHLDSKELIKALELKQRYYHEQIEAGKLKAFNSTIGLIKELLAYDIKIAVASSSRSVGHVLKVSDIMHLFEVVISGHDTRQGKPHPESFLKAAEQLSLHNNECVVFEDAKAGVRAAKSGGFLCVGIDRINKPEHFTLADLHVQDLDEVNYTKLTTLFTTRENYREKNNQN